MEEVKVMKNVVRMPLGVGVSSLVMMFITVTLASLMTLSLMMAYREKRISEKSALYIRAYYEADAAANIKKIEIMKQLESYDGKTQLRSVLSQIKDITICENIDKMQITYQVPVVGTQVLSVNLEVPIPYEKENKICIVSWYVRSTEERVYEEEGFGEIALQ